MIPLRPASLFRSRWAALFYAAGVLWLAFDIAGTKPAPEPAGNITTATGDDVDLNVLAAEVRQFESIR